MRRIAVAALVVISLCGCHVALSTIGSWSKVSGPPAPVNGAWLVPLTDGRVGVFGGSLSNGQPSFETALYDPMNGSWQKGNPMPGPAFPDVVTALGDGTVLVEGGRDDKGAIRGDTWLYDPVRDSWSRAGDMVEPRVVPNEVLLSDGRLMIAGGSLPVDASQQAFRPIPSAEIYDPASRRWSRAGSLNVARDGITLVPLGGGSALAAGGCQGQAGWSPPSTTSEVFDPAGNTWSLTTPVPFAICGAGGVELGDGRALVIDQYTFNGVERYFYQSSDDAYVYDPKTRAWSVTGGLAGGGKAVLRLKDGRVLVPEIQTGAQSGRTFKEVVGGQIYDPADNEWNYVTTTTLTMPLLYMFNGAPPVVLSLADGTAIVILQTSAIAFHPEGAPPSTQILDSTGLTLGLGVAALVIVLLLLLVYVRASRSDLSKLA